MRGFSSFLGFVTIAIFLLVSVPTAGSQTLRYTVSANVSGIVWDTAIPNCATNYCLITVTGVGNAANATSFPLACNPPGSSVCGQGNVNPSLTNVSVTVYDPILGVTYGPATFPPGFFTGIDNYNGGVGFGTNPNIVGYGGPAYPVSITLIRGISGLPYDFPGIYPSYDLKSPVMVGGEFLNCPAGGPCLNNSPPTIPVTMADGSTVQLSVSVESQLATLGHYWVQEEPPTNQWTTAFPMGQARYGHTATVLSSGKVLVVGGAAGTTAATTPEIYDPVADSWASTSSPACGRTSHTATLLADGRVLVVGGTQCPTSAEIFDPVAATWSTLAPIPVAFPGPATAVRLQDNRVLVAGGYAAEIYDPVANTWSATVGMAPLSNPIGVLLPSGSVLMLDNSSYLFTQIFTPATGAWGENQSFTYMNANITATALNTGSVLVTGANPQGAE